MATRALRLLPTVVVIFALASVLWFVASFAVLAQLLADGSMRDRTHVVFGYAGAAVAAIIVAGWLWALIASTRAGSLVSGPVQVMCAATAAAQVAEVLGMIMLTGGWDEPAGLILGHAVVAALLALLVSCFRSAPA